MLLHIMQLLTVLKLSMHCCCCCDGGKYFCCGGGGGGGDGGGGYHYHYFHCNNHSITKELKLKNQRTCCRNMMLYV